MARILVIDDHDTLREGMAVTLTRSGHTVTAARSGAGFERRPNGNATVMPPLTKPTPPPTVWCATCAETTGRRS